MKDENCSYTDNSQDMQDRLSLVVDYHTCNCELIAVPLINKANPNRIRRNIFFTNDFDLANKTIVGIALMDTSSESTYKVDNVDYTNLTAALSRQLSISFYDRDKKKYVINQMPLAALISPATVTNMKFPYHRMKFKPDMKQSFFNINGVTGFSPAVKRVLLLNVYYI